VTRLLRHSCMPVGTDRYSNNCLLMPSSPEFNVQSAEVATGSPHFSGVLSPLWRVRPLSHGPVRANISLTTLDFPSLFPLPLCIRYSYIAEASIQGHTVVACTISLVSAYIVETKKETLRKSSGHRVSGSVHFKHNRPYRGPIAYRTLNYQTHS
jgi:hypothetical protein